MSQYIAKYTIHLPSNTVIPLGFTLSDEEYKQVIDANLGDRVIIEGALPYFRLSSTELKAEMDKLAEELARRDVSETAQQTNQQVQTQNPVVVPQEVTTDTTTGNQ